MRPPDVTHTQWGGPSLKASQVSAYNSQSGCQAPQLGTRFPDGGGQMVSLIRDKLKTKNN